MRVRLSRATFIERFSHLLMHVFARNAFFQIVTFPKARDSTGEPDRQPRIHGRAGQVEPHRVAVSCIAAFCIAASCIRTYSDVFGRIRTYSDVFGHIRIYSDVFGRIRTYSDVFGRIRT